MSDLFNVISEQTGLTPFYNGTQLDSKEKVNVNFDQEPLDNVLAFLLRKKGLTWEYHKGAYVIRLKEPGEPDLGYLPEEAPLNVTGLVTDANGAPLPHATVYLKGAGKWIETGPDGMFHFRGIKKNEVITVSYTGFAQKDVPVKNRDTLKVVLEESVTGLDEVMVIAYGTSTRRNLTGAISRITAADIAQQPAGNPLLAMQGRVPGLHITQLSGLPGGEVKVELRGRNSIAAGNTPLYIVDGLPLPTTALTINNVLPEGNGISPLGASNPLNMINAADIESIEVLKDADATSIYGSRGANGIILVSTKKGQPGKMKLDATLYAGIGKVAHHMQFLDTRQYLEMRKEALRNDHANPAAGDYDLKKWSPTRYTNWEQEMLGGTAGITDGQLAITGGNSNMLYRVSGGYRQETTVYPGSFNYRKAAVHSKFIFSTADQKGQAVITAGYVAEKHYLPSVDLAVFTRMPPNTPANYTEENELNWADGYANPMGALSQPYKASTGRLLGHLAFNYELFPGLEFKASFGYNSILMDEKQPTPFSSLNPSFGYDTLKGGYTKFALNTFKNWIIEPQLSYQSYIGAGQITALLGVTFQEDIRDQKGFFAADFTSDAPQQLENILAASRIDALGIAQYFYRYNALFGRINYNLQGKYIFHLTARRDGSSRFGPNSGMSNFGSAGAAWIFSEEKWVRAAIPFLSFGKVRASYGITGNDQITDYAFHSAYAPGRVYDGQRGQLPARLSNDEYRWEHCKKLEAGLELGWNQNRMMLRAAYYHNRSSNQLINYSLPLTTGFSSILSNFPAIVENTGLELELSTINIKRRYFSWSTAFNISMPRNKLVSFPNIEASSYNSSLTIGQPLDILKGYQYLYIDDQTGIYHFRGIDKEGKELPDAKSFTRRTGVFCYGGLQNNLEYRQWQVNILLQFVGQDRYNYLLMQQAPGMAFVNQPVAVLDRWQMPGKNGRIQQFTQGAGVAYESFLKARQSDAAISNASFVRLKSLHLSYRLPQSLIKRTRLQSARFFVQGQNLFTLTNYEGRDPEVAADIDVYPPLRVWTLGLQLSL